MKNKEDWKDFKVVYIGGDDVEYQPFITTGSIYLVTDYWSELPDEDVGYYTFVNDLRYLDSYDRTLFKTLDEIREEKLNILLD